MRCESGGEQHHALYRTALHAARDCSSITHSLPRRKITTADSGCRPHVGLREPSLAAIGALGIPADESGVGELMELATMKLLQSRQLDHAFGQFVLAAQLYASTHNGASLYDMPP